MTGRFTAIVGHSNDPAYAQKLHALGHAGKVEYVTISGTDLARKRLRVTTDRGTECAIALPRHVVLEHGAILELSETRAIVVQLEELPWLCFEAGDKGTALRLGFLAGHHHWRVRFEGTQMFVAMDAPADTYTDRLKDELATGRVWLVTSDHE